MFQGCIDMRFNRSHRYSEFLGYVLVRQILYITEAEYLTSLRRKTVYRLRQALPEIPVEKIAEGGIGIHIRHGMKHKIDLPVIPLPVGLGEGLPFEIIQASVVYAFKEIVAD